MENRTDDFAWQGYLLQGRPDFVNYIRTGDVRWPAVWSTLSDLEEADAPVMLKACRFFFAFSSWEFDLAGCTLEPGEELTTDLRVWARFAVQSRRIMPELALQQTMRELVNLGAISAPFYEAVYQCYGEALAALAAGSWPELVSLPAPPDPPDEDLPRAAARLARCTLAETSVPESLRENSDWSDFAATLLDRHHVCWSHGYAAILRNMDVLADDRAAL